MGGMKEGVGKNLFYVHNDSKQDGASNGNAVSPYHCTVVRGLEPEIKYYRCCYEY